MADKFVTEPPGSPEYIFGNALANSLALRRDVGRAVDATSGTAAMHVDFSRGARAVLLQTITNAAVKPVLECVVNNGGGSYTARFGYSNLNTVAVTIPVGSYNKFTPTPINRGQPTVFQPGRQRFVFDVPFNGSNLVWSLEGPDNQNRTSTASANSTPCNTAPVANAGPAQTVAVGSTVTLDGSGSSDADGDSLTFNWVFVSIPAGSTATLTGSTTVHPSFVADKSGSYTVQLTVNDGHGNNASATVVISTQNSPPVANAGPNQTVTTHTTVQLDGSKSSDVDGDPLTYQWSFVSTPPGSAAALSNATIVNPTFVTDVKGTYVVQLVVNDGHVNSTPSQVTISDVNSPPVANAGPNQTVTTRTLVTLDGSGSTDVDGDSLTFTWSILSAPAGSTATLSDVHAVKPTFTVDVPGNYVIQLIVNDGTVNSTPATVTISEVNSPPVANAGPAQSVTVGSVVQLDGTGSSDADGDPLTYSWAILSTPTGSVATLSFPTSAKPSFTADLPGNYVIQLIVNDGFVNSAPSTVSISTINSVPVANAGPNQTVKPGTTVQLDGSASSDADRDPLTYRWALTVRPAGSASVLSDTTAVKPTFIADLPGTYVAQLIVNDGKVDSPPATVTITAVAIPSLSLNAPANLVGLPGQTVPVTFVASNPGTSDALQATLTQGANVFTLGSVAAGQNQSAIENFLIPVFSAKGVGETDAGYLGRMQASDNLNLTLPASLTWSDVFGDSLGPVSATASVVEELPIVTVVLTAPSTVQAGDTVSYSISVANSGHATAIVNLTITLPDSSVQSLTLNPNTLAPGANTTAAAQFRVPATQKGAITANAQVTWQDSSGNVYGPLSSGATTQINGISPPVLASCLPVGSLSAMVRNGTVTSYVPNGFWNGGITGVRVVPIEGGGSPSLVATPDIVNSCASNSVTGQTVCTSNNTDIYLLTDSTLTNTLHSGTTGTVGFSGGTCKTCGVAINAGTNQAVITLGLSGPSSSGIQLLDLATNTLSTPVPTSSGVRISENISVDPTRNLILSASENSVFELFQPGSSGSQVFDQVIGRTNPIEFQMDATAEDCSTGIALASVEGVFNTFGQPTGGGGFVLADLSQASLVPGTPGSWTAAGQFQEISELSGMEGFAVAPGSHLGVATGEFGDNQFGVFGLPATSGTGMPAIQDWVFAPFPNPGEPTGQGSFISGEEPHTVTAYVSPTSGKAYGVIADDGIGFLAGDSNFLAVIDLQAALAAPRVFGHQIDTSKVDLIASGIIRFVPTRTFLVFPASPNLATQGTQNLAVTINGANAHFVQGATTVSLGPGITIQSLTVNSANNLVALVNIDPLAAVGPRVVSVTTGSEALSMISSVFNSGFNVAKGPAAISQIAPGSGAQGQSVTVTISGVSTHFAQGVTTADFQFTSGGGSSISSFTVNSPTSISATLNLSPLEVTGSHIVTITTGGEIITSSFSVNPGPAKVVNVSPNAGPQGVQGLTINITGSATHFASNVSFLGLDTSLQVQSFTVNSPTSATARIGVFSFASLGPHSLSVTTRGEVATLANAINVTPGVPELFPIGGNNPQGITNAAANIDGEFTHFVQGVSVLDLGPGVTIASFTVSSPTGGRATYSVAPLATLGPRNITVTTGSEVATAVNGFNVSNGNAAIGSLSPSSVAQGQQNVAVALPGSFTHFTQGVSTATFGSGITVDSLTVNSATSATAVISVDPAATGTRKITITTEGEIATSIGLLTITAGTPVLTNVNPASAQPGTQTVSVAIAGLNTHFSQTTSVANFGVGITVASLTVNSPVSATAVVNIASTAALGARSVTMTTGSEVATINNGFSVFPPPPAIGTNLTEGMEITAITPIVGTVSGTWTLSYALASGDGNGPPPVFVPLASGTTAITNGLLGTLDPTMLLNGSYVIRLSSTDAFGQNTTISTSVEVARNLKVGNFTLSFADMSVPAPGLPITVTRTYDSRDKQSHDFGVGWTLSLVNLRLQKNGVLGSGWQMTQSGSGLSVNFCLAEIKPHFVIITFPDGRVFKFQSTTQPQCQQASPIGSANISFVQISGTTGTQGARLQIAGNSSVLVDPPTAGVVDLIDVSTSADINPTVFQLTTAEGYTYTIDQNLGATAVSDPNGNTLTVNSSGISSSSGKSVAFVRNAQGRITQINDANGNTLNYAYNGSGDLTGFTDRVGNTTICSYDPTHLLTNIVAPNGVQAVRNTYDASGRLVSTTDPAGNTTNYTHALASNQEAVKDRLGNTTTYTYDADGNITQTIDALGNTTSATYDSNDNRLTDTDALGKTTVYVYDVVGNRTSETDPLGNKTQYTYNQLKQPLTVTDPLGNVTTNTYDAHGNLLTTTDARGGITTYTYGAQGLPLTMQDAARNTTQFAYDGNGNLTKQIDALGNVSSFTYDGNGNKLTQAVTRTRSDGTKETLTTQYVYDASNRLVKTVNPDGSATQVAYNSIGKQSDAFDALNRKTHFDYDSNGRLITTTYADGKTESITYDNDDRRLTSTDRAGHVTSYTYDAVGRLTKTTFADNSTIQTVYDVAGRAVQTVDGLNHATVFGYDDAGRRTSVTDALGKVTIFGYDAAGNQTSMTDALNHTTTFVYDTLNRRVATIYPDHTTDSVAYDALGRQVQKTDQAGKITQFSYDALGRLTSVTQTLNGNPLVTSYGYDELGNRVTQTDANGHTTSYAYDQLGRRITRSLPLGMKESYGYDAVGNLTSKTDFNNHTTTYAYDPLNRLLSKTADAFFSAGSCAGGACGATKVSYTYTATGRRLSMTDLSGTTNYTYDTRDRLLTKASSFGTLAYTYDAAGNTLTLVSSNAGGASMTYGYDALNRLSSVTDISGVTSYSYDAVGNLSGYTYPNGVATSYVYDTQNRLTSMQSTCNTAGPACATPGTAIASYAYTLGAAGNRLSVAELSGRTVSYGYDDLYRLTSETVASDPKGNNGQVSYTFDNVGNRVQRTSTLPGVVTTGLLNYDANDRTTTDPYDQDGNLLNSGAGANVYDFENHLVQAGGVKLVYDGDGNRVKETIASTTTSYLVADQNLTGYAEVLDELQAGSVSRVYSYGLELISERQTLSGTLATSFYGFDGHGSVRFLTDPTGAITDTCDYDAFGILISQSGTTPNNYLFAGEQFDPALGIYYNRARYYDQRLGRFWTMDTSGIDPASPPSLHRYLYASNSPVNRIDPSGNEDLVSVMAAAATQMLTNGLIAFNVRLAYAMVQGQFGVAALQSATNAFWIGVATGTPLIGPAVQALLLTGATVAALNGQLKPIDYAELGTYLVIGGLLGYFGGSPAGEPTSSAVADTPAEGGGITLELKYKAEWGPQERAYADMKVQQLNDAAIANQLVSTDPVRAGKTARILYTSAGNNVPQNFDIDHILDLQLGGGKNIENLQPLPLSVNRSLGAQIGNILSNLPRGTRITSVTIGP